LVNQIFWANLTAFIVCICLGPIFIPLLHKFKFGQEIRGCGPKEHLKKAGTPTMGGVFILLSVCLTVIYWCEFDLKLKLVAMITLGYGLIGFIDDFIKIVMHRNLGLTSFQKIILQITIAVIYIMYVSKHNLSTNIWIPGCNYYWDADFLYYIVVVLLLVGTTNAVNLTDGLDGLVSCVSIPILITLGYFSILAKMYNITAFSAAFVGALMGFLIFNRYPAKVFMGDTGSLAIGGAVASLCLVLQCEILLIILGGVYVFEALSVILQVGSFKFRNGKRIFRMAPLHHHFELGGWSEVKTVMVFTLASFAFCVLSILLWNFKYII